MSGPYAAAAWAYRKAGWQGVIPIGRGPAQKSPPPTGFTGYAGLDPSGPDIQTWIDGREASFNVGIHLPRGVYVLDVDAHSGKPAVESLAALVRQAGELPATWTNTARGQHAPSRQHFFRAELPEGRVWHDHPGSGLDSLHVGHRYAVVAPSINPEVNAEYCWYDEAGQLYEGAPEITDLAELPARWIEVLTKPGEPMAGSAADDSTTMSAIKAFRAGEMCDRVRFALRAELDRIATATDGGSLHDSGKLFPLVAYGIEGHIGVAKALAEHQAAYVDARVRLRGEAAGSAAADWWRQVRGAVGKKLPPNWTPAQACDCEHPAAGIIAGTAEQLRAREVAPPPRHAAPEVDSAHSEQPGEPSALDRLRAELISSRHLDDLPEHEPLIPGALNLDSLAWIYGAPASFKSFLALDLAGCVSAGLPWQGFEVGPSGAVVYLVAEGVSGIRARVRAWEEHNGVTMEDVHFLPRAVQASSDEWKVLVALVTEIKPLLILVDTQARVTAGMEENSATEMGNFVRRLDQLRAATGACVLPLHHVGRNGEHMRGSIAIDGAADTTIKIVRDEDRVIVTCTKQKDAEEFEPFVARIAPVGESIILKREGSAAAPTGGRWPTFLLEWWKKFEGDPIGLSLAVEVGVVTRSTFHDHAKELLRRGILRKNDSGRYPTYSLTEAPPGVRALSDCPAVRHAGQSDSGLPESGGQSRTVPDSGSLCSICGEILDAMLVRAGATVHPSC